MYAIIKDNKILYIVEKQIKTDMEIIEFSWINNPIYRDGIIIEEWETPEEKKARILSILISSDDYKSVDTEWVFLEYSDIWKAIIARFFKSDPNAEMAYLQKWNFLTSLSEKTEEQQAELDLIRQGYIAKEEFKDFLLTLINK